MLLTWQSAHMQGSVVLRGEQRRVVKSLEDGSSVEEESGMPTVCHDDIIKNAFWEQHPELLA